jgi:hypothetical protein
MNSTNVGARIVVLALVATISLVGGMAGMRALMSPSSATGAGLHGAWQERTGLADTTSARRSASTIAANPMSVLPQAYLPFIAGQVGPSPVPSATATPTVTPTAVPIGAVLVPAGNGVAAFRIGRTEVTNAQYAQCVAAGACTVPATDYLCNYPSYAAHPVVCVTREQAREYAAWVGGALPTETQWLRACQGDDGRTYPWGNQAPDETLANFADFEDIEGRGTTPVGSYPAGASPYGALDMAGNVAEWTEPDDGDDGRYIVRGGAWDLNAVYLGCGARSETGYDDLSYNMGFRVVSPGP